MKEPSTHPLEEDQKGIYIWSQIQSVDMSEKFPHLVIWDIPDLQIPKRRHCGSKIFFKRAFRTKNQSWKRRRRTRWTSIHEHEKFQSHSRLETRIGIDSMENSTLPRAACVMFLQEMERGKEGSRGVPGVNGASGMADCRFLLKIPGEHVHRAKNLGRIRVYRLMMLIRYGHGSNDGKWMVEGFGILSRAQSKTSSFCTTIWFQDKTTCEFEGEIKRFHGKIEYFGILSIT